MEMENLKKSIFETLDNHNEIIKILCTSISVKSQLDDDEITKLQNLIYIILSKHYNMKILNGFDTKQSIMTDISITNKSINLDKTKRISSEYFKENIYNFVHDCTSTKKHIKNPVTTMECGLSRLFVNKSNAKLSFRLFILSDNSLNRLIKNSINNIKISQWKPVKKPIWSIQKLLWISKLKDDKSAFTYVPKEIIKVICEYIFKIHDKLVEEEKEKEEKKE